MNLEFDEKKAKEAEEKEWEEKRKRNDEENAQVVQEMKEPKKNYNIDQEIEPKGLEGLKDQIVASLEESFKNLKSIPESDRLISGREVGGFIHLFRGGISKPLNDAQTIAGSVFPFDHKKSFNIKKVVKTLAEWKAVELCKDNEAFLRGGKKNEKIYFDYVTSVVNNYLDNLHND